MGLLPSARARHDWRWWLRITALGFAGYTALAVMWITEAAARALHQGLVVDWSGLLHQYLPDEYLCALAVPPIFWLCDIFPVDRHTWRRNAPVLLAGILAIALVFIGGAVLTERAASFGNVLLVELGPIMVELLAIAGVAHGLAFYKRAQEQERAAAQLQARLSRAQLDALRSQLQPHFLFNALNGAAALMHTDVAAADRMLTELSDLLRLTLRHSATDEIPLAEELALLDRYLSIMRARFLDRLTIRSDVAPPLLDALVPQFLLQPLVENALEHGIARRPGPGMLEIRAEREDGRVRITVADDGPGVAAGASAPNGSGIGLANTRARLAQLYGDEQSLVLESASPTGGARATVTLPYRRAATPELAP